MNAVYTEDKGIYIYKNPICTLRTIGDNERVTLPTWLAKALRVGGLQGQNVSQKDALEVNVDDLR